MTSNDLVTAVSALSPPSGCPIVASKPIIDWCTQQVPVVEVDGSNGRVHRHFEDADKAECQGQHRLAKFKRGTAQNALVGWCLIEDMDRVILCDQTWLSVPVDSATGIWDWEAVA